MDVSVGQLQRAVEGQHGGRAVLIGAEPAKEKFLGQTVWEGVVHVFERRAISKPRGPMRGLALSTAATSADSLPCCT
jgi:hypothetical protein